MTLATTDCIDGNHGNRERPQSQRSNWLLAGWRRRGRGFQWKPRLRTAPPCRVQPKARFGGVAAVLRKKPTEGF